MMDRFWRTVVLAVAIFTTQQSQSQCIVINEIMINPNGPNDGQNSPNTSEWVELYNTCSTPVDISCYALSDGDFTVVIPPGTILAPYGYYVIGSSNSNVALQLNWGTCNCTTELSIGEVGIFGNSNEQLVLQNSAGVLEDAIVWGSGQLSINISTTTASGCPQRSFNYSNATIVNTFENIGSAGGGDCSKARACDGSATWVELCNGAPTPGTSNNGQTQIVTFTASDNSICANECVNFTYTGNGTPTQYSWQFEGSSTASSISAGPFGICYPTAGSYDVSLTITNACGTYTTTLEDYIQVNASNAVTITAVGSTSICPGGEVELTTNSAGPYQWMLGATPIPGATSSTLTVNAAGDYSLNTTGNCGGTSNVITVTIQPALTPEIVADGALNLCNGQSVGLAVDAIYDTYQWYLNNVMIPGEQSAQLTVSQTGTYSVFVTTGDCEGTSETIDVNSYVVLAPPVVADFSACQGSMVNLQVNSIYDSYQWLNGGVPIEGAASAQYNFQLTGNADISVLVSDHTCDATSEVIHITSIPTPVVSITPNADVQVCQDSYLLTGTSSSGNYQWFNQGIPIPGATSSTYTVTSDGDYSFRSTDASGECSAISEEVSVILATELSVEILASTTEACQGETVTLTVQGNYDTITWFNQFSGSSTTVTQSGQYSVVVNSNGCEATDEIVIQILPLPIANAGMDVESDCDQGAILTGTGTGTLVWQSHPTLTITDGSSIAIANPSQTTTYTLIASNGQCIAKDEVVVTVDCSSIYIPNVFTPNGDGLNDFFQIIARGVKTFRLEIYNRWGELLFESDDPEKVWNGGKQEYYAPDGVYFWTLVALDYQGKSILSSDQSRGHITIVR